VPAEVTRSSRADYFALLNELLAVVLADERDALDAAEIAIASALGAERQVIAFGTGHSHCLALEFCDRAGGLVAPKVLRDGVLSMQEGLVKSTVAERLGDYGPMLVDLADLAAGDVLIVISNSGRNAVPVQAAQEAKRRGAVTIAVTSIAHSQASAVRIPATQRLFEVADIVIDNHGCPGDAALSIDGLPAAVGATSTVVGATIMQALSVGVAVRMAAAGTVPEIYVSANQDNVRIGPS
jgi:uncharacterized phosphosugar-binding protein